MDHNRLGAATGEMSLTRGSSRARRRSFTLHVPIDESWLGPIHDLGEAIKSILTDVMETFRSPLMSYNSLVIVSVYLLLFDRLLVSLLGMVDTLLEASAAQTEQRNGLLELARVFTASSTGLLSNNSEISRYAKAPMTMCNAGACPTEEDCNGKESLFHPYYLLIATMAVFFTNTSYFGMLMTPLYCRLMDSTTTASEFSTEVLLCLLLFLFGIDTLAVLTFFLLGYKVLLSPTTVVDMLVPNGDSGTLSSLLGNTGHGYDAPAAAASASFDTIGVDFNGASNTISLFLVLSTLVWILCVSTSTIVRSALYHSMGE